MRELEEYVSFLEYQLKYSKATVQSYEGDILQFLEFCRRENISFLDIDYDFPRFYLKNLKEELKEKASSTSRKISSIRGFYQFLIKENKVQTNFFKMLTLPKKEKSLPRFFEYQELEELFQAPDKETALGQRDSLILELLYATGMRVSELVSVKLSAIDFTNQKIKVVGKGKKTRFVYYEDVARDALMLYLEEGRQELNKQNLEELFLNNRGGVLTTRGIRYILEQLIKKTSLHKKISPHMIRHSFATHLLNEGCDLLSVQELLGHESLKATSIYTHVTSDRMKDVYLKTHPRAKNRDKSGGNL